MTMSGDDRFEREMRSVIREAGSSGASPELRERVAATLTVRPVQPAPSRVGWPLVAAAGLAIVLAAVVLRPQPISTALPPAASTASDQVGVGSAVAATAATEIPGPMQHPGEVQTGQLLTATDGVVINTAGSILTTHDGGATWFDVTPSAHYGASTEHDVERVFFLDPQHGWFATYDVGSPDGLMIWRTYDGGTGWTGQPMPGLRAVNWQLGFVTPTVGWLATDPGGESPKPELRMTTNSGDTWTDPIDLTAATGRSTLEQIAFLDGQHGVMTGDNLLLFTSDAGRTWSPAYVGATDYNVVEGTPRYGAVHVISAQKAFVVVDWLDPQGRTRGQTILETFDGGGVWASRYSDARHRFWDFIDESHWVAVDDEWVASTTDGASWGASTWTGLPAGLSSAVLQFADPMHGWAEVAGGTACPGGSGDGTGLCAGAAVVPMLFKTIDGGSTWSPVGDCDPASSNGFACPSPRPS